MRSLRVGGALCRFLKIDARMACAAEELYQKIDTFVFFDLETTDLIKGNRMPQIIELAMVAAGRNSLKRDQRNKLALPRIMHKLTIPVKPTQQINPQASYLCNLWNDSLEHVNSFDENTYDMIMKFINRLPGLICFVAHNGNRFDYPIFLAEIERLNKTFPDRILCIDSLEAFKEFYSETDPATVQSMQTIPPGRDEVDEELLALKNQKLENSFDDIWDDSLCSVLDEFDKVQTREISKSSTIGNCENGTDVLDSISNRNQSPNSAPSGHITPPIISPATMQAINETTPESQIIRTSRSSKLLKGVRKQLNFNDSIPKNFKLATIHLHMIGCDAQNQHSAEDDCLSMIRCIMQMGTHFAEWADCNAVSLNVFKRNNA